MKIFSQFCFWIFLSFGGRAELSATVRGEPFSSAVGKNHEQRLQLKDFSYLLSDQVGDALKQFASFQITESSGLPKTALIRGYGSGQILVVTDGLVLNDPSSPAGSFDFSELRASTFESVALLSPAESVIWGSHALGGVLRLRSRTPESTKQATARFSGFEPGLREAALRALLPLNGRLSSAWGFNKSQGTSVSAAAAGAEREFLVQESFFTKLSGEQDQWNLILNGRSRAYGTDSWGISGFRDSTDSQSVNSETQLQADRTFALSSRGQIEVRLVHLKVDRKDTDPLSFGESASTGVRRGLDIKGIFRPEFAHFNEFVLGAAHSAEDVEVQETGTQKVSKTQASRGIFFRPRFKFGGFLLVPGVRQEWRDSAHSSIQALSFVGPDLSWRGIDYATAVEWYGGLRWPSLYQLHSSYGNPGLRPETMEGFHFSQSLVFDPSFQAQILCGVTWLKNLIDYDFSSSRFENVSQSRNFFCEVGSRWKRNQHTLHVSFADLLAKTADGLLALRRPRQNFTVSWTQGWGKETSSIVDLLWRSRGEDILQGERLGTPEFRQTNVGLNQKLRVSSISTEIDLRFEIRNVFDEKKSPLLAYSREGRQWGLGVESTFGF